MKILAAEFTVSAPGPKQYPDDGLPEIALIGRSNVGKSSLINRLLLRKNLAHTSSQPGKTQFLNFYRVKTERRPLYLVDLPGYGYAKVSKKQRKQWGAMIETYLLQREMLKRVLLLIDFRHPPTEDDVLMYNWLNHYEIPTSIVMTKADKVPRGRWEKHKKIIREKLQIPETCSPTIFSSVSGIGRESLWEEIDRAAAGDS